MSSRFRSWRAVAVPGLLLLGIVMVVRFDVQDERRLRVCADPNNLPFSSARGEGFEDQLMRLVGQSLGARIDYTWWPQRRGFLRQTLYANRCDVIAGVPSDLRSLSTTRPYYTSTYVFVTRVQDRRRIRSFDDPVLRQLRIGVQLVPGHDATTPALDALSRRGLAANLVGYTVNGNYAEPNPSARIMDAIARGDIDVAVVWGPLAGYFALREPTPLEITPVDRASVGMGLSPAFAISMGVRRGDERLRRELDNVLIRRRNDIDRLLAAYGIPRIDLDRGTE